MALNGSWDVNYGQGGVPGGASIPFVVAADHLPVEFLYNAATHILTIGTPPSTTSKEPAMCRR